MAKRTVADVFPNRAFETVICSAANALTFSQVSFGVGLFQGVAAIIHRIEWFPNSATIRELVAVADSLVMGLTNRDDLATLDPQNQSVLANKSVYPMMVGAVVGLLNQEAPIVSDFNNMPGGGLIIPANPLYIGVATTGFAAAANVDAVIYLTFRSLTDSEYVELVQTIMPANI